MSAPDTEPQTRICCDGRCTQQGRIGCPLVESAKARAAEQEAREQEAEQRIRDRQDNLFLIRCALWATIAVGAVCAVLALGLS